MAKMQATVPAAQNDLVNTIEGNRAGLATGRELNGAVRRGDPAQVYWRSSQHARAMAQSSCARITSTRTVEARDEMS